MARQRSLMFPSVKIEGPELEGATPPSGIVGERGYPRVPVIIGVPPGASAAEAAGYDDPEGWWGAASLEDILRIRSGMIYLITRARAGDFPRLVDREIPLSMVSSKPVDAEARLRKIIVRRGLGAEDPLSPPIGLAAEAESLAIKGNPRIPRPLEKLYNDELKASEAVWELYKEGISVYTLQRALAFGILGNPRRRRLVPTRWAITAVDTILASRMLGSVRHNKEVNDVELYRGEYLANGFWILLAPGSYSFEWVEIWHPSAVLTHGEPEPVVITNREGHRGEALYMDGGYQAARMAVLESLYKRGRRASILVVREVLPEYRVCVGNWHIRETVRASLKAKPQIFQDPSEALEVVKRELGAGARDLRFKKQSTLDVFFGPSA